MKPSNLQPRRFSNPNNIIISPLLPTHQSHGIQLHHLTCFRISALCRGQALRGGSCWVRRGGDEAWDNEFVDKDAGFGVFDEGVTQVFKDFLGFIVRVVATRNGLEIGKMEGLRSGEYTTPRIQ